MTPHTIEVYLFLIDFIRHILLNLPCFKFKFIIRHLLIEVNCGLIYTNLNLSLFWERGCEMILEVRS